MDNIYRYGSVTRVIRAARLAQNRDALDYVAQLRNIVEDIADP